MRGLSRVRLRAPVLLADDGTGVDLVPVIGASDVSFKRRTSTWWSTGCPHFFAAEELEDDIGESTDRFEVGRKVSYFYLMAQMPE